MKSLRKILCLLLSVILVVTTISSTLVFAEKESLPWDKDIKYYDNTNGNKTWFNPPDKYVSMQNPPSFTWGKYEGGIATYDLKICTDAEMKKVAYEVKDIENNFYVFPHTMEAGVVYYWSVRIKIGSKYTTWSTPRRFRIDPDATEFTIAGMDEFLANLPTTHPRLCVTKDTLDEFRSLKDKSEGSKEVYDTWIQTADKLVEEYLIDEEPEMIYHEDPVQQTLLRLQLTGMVTGNVERGYDAAFAYLLTGDKKYARYAIDCAAETSTWNLVDGLSSFARSDQGHATIVRLMSYIYDWCYDAMEEDEKELILTALDNRCKDLDKFLESMPKSPFDSHGWGEFTWLGLASLATYGDLPRANERLKIIIPAYIAMCPVWSYQDGGWSQGTAYWANTVNDHIMAEIFTLGGYFDFYKTAWMRNSYYQSLYAFPAGSEGSFGDESARGDSVYFYNRRMKHLTRQRYFVDNPVIDWLYNQMDTGEISDTMDYLYESNHTEGVAPSWYQLSHEFNDVGWIVMTSDLVDRNRIMMTFKSSQYGSYNHSQPDQNGFVIEGFGEMLAARAGYYDFYHSEHDSGITRKTFSNNSITMDLGNGQVDDSFNSKGKISGYLTQIDFDLAKGDATQAYQGKLGNFERNIVYLRPDMFVVVDDLKARKDENTVFEWHLNSRVPIEIYDEGNGGRITNGAASLDTKLHYPLDARTFYNDIFAGPDMKEIKPNAERYGDAEVDTRMWFETKPVNETKMIVTLDVHQKDRAAEYVSTEYFDKYVKLSFEDGTIMYVNLGENTDEVVTDTGISFTGDIVVYNDRSIMLVDGTSLKQGEVELIKFEKPASLVMGADELSISTYEDNKVSINKNNDYINKIEKVTNYEGKAIGKEYGISMEEGFLKEGSVDKKTGEVSYSVEKNDDYVTFTMEVDNYQLMLNGKIYTYETTTTMTDKETGETKPIETQVEIVRDGVSEYATLTGYLRRDGKYALSGTFDMGSKKYRAVEKNPELVFGSYSLGEVGNLGNTNISSTTLEGNKIVLEAVPMHYPKVNTYEDYNSILDKATLFKEAEAFEGTAKNAKIYDSKMNLSGKQGVQLFDTPGTHLQYTFEVEEEGVYDLAIKYVAWREETETVRGFAVNGEEYIFTLERTHDWGTKDEYWRAAYLDCGIHLTPGTHTFDFEPFTGMWNYDWLVLIKR